MSASKKRSINASTNSHEEDLWGNDGDYEGPDESDLVEYLNNSRVGKRVVDVISPLLNEIPETRPPVAKRSSIPHIHIWRKEYKMCMIKGCGAKRSRYVY